MRDYGIHLTSFSLLLLQVASQTSNVTSCTPLYEWSLNSKNQTPCLVAAFLESVCEGPVEVNAIPEKTHYSGPDVSHANRCRCSTVTYSLLSACGGCQDRIFIPWTNWTENCAQVEVGQFLDPIPAAVVVPSWAYLDVTKTNNIFNPILANQSLSQLTTSVTSVSPTSSVTTTTTTPNGLPSPPPSPATKKSNSGAIAGGVVGGLILVVAIGLAVLFYFRRRNRPLEGSRHFNSNFSTSPPPMQDRRTVASPLSITPFPYKEPTFGEAETIPGSPVTSAVHTTFDTPSVATPAFQIIHQYTGSAEL